MNSPGWRIPLPNPRGTGWSDLERRLLPEEVAGIDAAVERVTRTAPGKYLSRMSLRAGDRIVLVSVRDVVWVQSHGNLLRLHLEQASYEHRMTMKEMQQHLNPEDFMRVHRNAIVNLDHVVEFELPQRGNSVVRLRNGKVLPISGVARVALRRGLLSRSFRDIELQ